MGCKKFSIRIYTDDGRPKGEIVVFKETLKQAEEYAKVIIFDCEYACVTEE